MQRLAELETQYLTHHEALGHSKKTRDHYADSFTTFHRYLAAKNLLPTSGVLTAAVMQDFAVWLRETPVRPWRGSTRRTVPGIHGVLKDLRAFVRYLADEELIEKAPKVPVPKLPQTLFPVLADADLLRLLQCRQLDAKSEIGRRNRALVAFMLDTGVRLSEVAHLDLADLRLADGEARIAGKGQKERMVFFSEGVAEALRRWLADRGNEPGSLFWLKPEGVRQVLVRIKRETGLPLLFAHQLRHTALTMLVRENVDLHTIKRLAGHASVTTTEAYLALAYGEMKQKQQAASPFDRIAAQLEPLPAKRRRRLKST